MDKNHVFTIFLFWEDANLLSDFTNPDFINKSIFNLLTLVTYVKWNYLSAKVINSFFKFLLFFFWEKYLQNILEIWIVLLFFHILDSWESKHRNLLGNLFLAAILFSCYLLMEWLLHNKLGRNLERGKN